MVQLINSGLLCIFHIAPPRSRAWFPLNRQLMNRAVLSWL